MTTTASTRAFRTVKPLRLRISRLFDIVLVSDAAQIGWLNQQLSINSWSRLWHRAVS